MDMETDEQQKARMELYNALLEGLSDIEAERVIPAEEAIKMFGRLQVQVEQNLSSNYISGIHLIKKSVEQFIRSVVA